MAPIFSHKITSLISHTFNIPLNIEYLIIYNFFYISSWECGVINQGESLTFPYLYTNDYKENVCVPKSNGNSRQQNQLIQAANPAIPL